MKKITISIITFMMIFAAYSPTEAAKPSKAFQKYFKTFQRSVNSPNKSKLLYDHVFELSDGRISGIYSSRKVPKMFEKYEMKYLRRLKLSEIEVVTLKKGMGDLIDDNIPSNIEQQPGTKIIVVESGYIQMTKRADDGGSRVILYFRSGNDGFECIGWRVDQVG